MGEEEKDEELGEIFGEKIFNSEETTEHSDLVEDINNSVMEKDPNHLLKKEAISSIENEAQKSNEYGEATPRLSSKDIDAYWENDQNTGEEHSLGSVATPDQDQVDAVSEPWGLEYEDEEELNINKKVKRKRKEIENLEQER